MKKDQNNFYSACEGKAAYDTREMAERVARAMNMPHRAQNRKDTGHAPARAYRCPYCGAYHITGTKRIRRIEIKEG